MSDIFGVNGRRILDGLVAGHPADRILDGLTNHVHAKLKPLAQALAAALDPLALIKLKIQIEALDRAAAAIADLDTRIRAELTEHQRPLRLLQTIPGIDFGSACTILARSDLTWEPSVRRAISALEPGWPGQQHQRRQAPLRPRPSGELDATGHPR